jgi:hypothetical protein
MKKLKSPKISIRKVNIASIEGLKKMDARPLDKLYEIDLLYQIDKEKRFAKDGPNLT